MILQYIYHSGFVIKGMNFALLIDYYMDTPQRYVHEHFLQFPGKLYILASHVHPDHFNPEILEWQNERPDIQYILSYDIKRKLRHSTVDAVFLKKGEMWQDEELTVQAFGSTDVGVSFLIDAEGERIFHAGDLNNWHWEEESTPEEVCLAEKAWHQELDTLAKATDHIDLAMFPVDPRLGKDYMRGAKEFIKKIKVHRFVPMHCWDQYDKANAFRPFIEATGGQFISIPESDNLQ